MTVQYHESPFPFTYKVVNQIAVSSGAKFGITTCWGWSQTGSAPSNQEAKDLATTANAAFVTNCIPHMTNQFTLQGTTVTDLSKTDGGFGEVTSSISGSGGVSPLNPSVCALVNYKVQNRYRGGKGRTYLPFGTTADLLGTTAWNTTAIAAFTTAWQAYLTAIGQNGSISTVAQVIRSYFKGGQTNDDPSQWAPKNEPMPRVAADGVTLTPVPYIVIGFTINPTLSHQERRAPAA